MRIKKIIQPPLLALALLLALTRLAAADGQGWKHLFSLAADQTGGHLLRPLGLFIDAQSERYYVTDSGHDRLVSFAKDGRFLQAFNAGGALKKPIDLTKLADGRLLVLEKGRNTVTEINLKTRSVTPHALEYQGRKLAPRRLKLHGGHLYVLDQASGGIMTVDDNFQVTGQIACPGCRAGFADFSFKGDELYALPQLGAQVLVFDSQGTLARKIALTPAPEFPVSLAVDGEGGLLVLERHAGTVARYLADGRLTGRHLGAEQPAARLSYPAGMQLDPWGRVCVVDEGNGRVSVFQP